MAAEIGAGYYDPCLFRDDDGRVYLYEGSSGDDGLRAYELDPKTFNPIREADIPASRDPTHRGWEGISGL